MATMPLQHNEAAMCFITEATRDKKSAEAIAKSMPIEVAGKKVGSGGITTVWARYGGKTSFLAEMRRRAEAGLPFADPYVSKQQIEKKLLSEDELQIFADELRENTWPAALRNLNRPDISKSQMVKYIRNNYGRVSSFFEAFPRSR